MTTPDPDDHRASEAALADASLTLRQERARIGTQWVAAGTVRIRRRVVSETRTVEVTVRREELVIDTDAAPDTDAAMVGVDYGGVAVGAPTGPPPPLVLVLREERAEVSTRVFPYERVTAHVVLAHAEQSITTQVRTETVDYTVEPT